MAPVAASTDLLSELSVLGLRSSKEDFLAFLTQAHKSALDPRQTLQQFFALERRVREATNLARRVRAACLGSFKPRDQIDLVHPRMLDLTLLEHIYTLGFISQGHNVLFRGPSGVGKTMFAKNVGHAALLAGFTVRFTTLAAALADLLQQESIPAFERRLKRYLQPQLLILDELGYLPCDSRAADILYNLISRRHETRSTIITTNLAFKQWGTVFPGAACVSALVDRFAQHCHCIDIDADSWRHRHGLERHPVSSSPSTPR